MKKSENTIKIDDGWIENGLINENGRIVGGDLAGGWIDGTRIVRRIEHGVIVSDQIVDGKVMRGWIENGQFLNGWLVGVRIKGAQIDDAQSARN